MQRIWCTVECWLWCLARQKTEEGVRSYGWRQPLSVSEATILGRTLLALPRSSSSLGGKRSMREEERFEDQDGR